MSTSEAQNSTERENTVWRRAVAVLLLLGLAWATPFTSDEGHYLTGGMVVRRTMTFDAVETYKHGPLFYLGQQVPAMLGVDAEPLREYRPFGRMSTIVFTLLASLVLVLIARRASGPGVALIALALFVTNPLALGHGSLITADMPMATCQLLTLLMAWQTVQVIPAWAAASLARS